MKILFVAQEKRFDCSPSVDNTKALSESVTKRMYECSYVLIIITFISHHVSLSVIVLIVP